MFRGLKDSEFDTVFAKARSGSEMFKDIDNVDLHNVNATLPCPGRESTEMETDIPPIQSTRMIYFCAFLGYIPDPILLE